MQISPPLTGTTLKTEAQYAADVAATPDEHAASERTLAKVFRRILPFIFACYVISYLDRTNVGFAALTMNHDLGLTAEQFGWGAGLFFIGYFLFEIPSNLIMQKVGARVWIAFAAWPGRRVQRPVGRVLAWAGPDPACAGRDGTGLIDRLRRR